MIFKGALIWCCFRGGVKCLPHTVLKRVKQRNTFSIVYLITVNQIMAVYKEYSALMQRRNRNERRGREAAKI